MAPTKRKREGLADAYANILLRHALSLLNGIYSFEDRVNELGPLMKQGLPKAHEEFLTIGENITHNLQQMKKLYGALKRNQAFKDYLTDVSYHTETGVESWERKLEQYRQHYGEQLKEYSLKPRLDRLIRKNRRLRKDPHKKDEIFF